MHSAVSTFSPTRSSSAPVALHAVDRFEGLEARFIENWGELAEGFGMQEGVGQLHAVLYLATGPLSVETLASELELDLDTCRERLETLASFGIVRAVTTGCRDAQYEAERDPWSWFMLTVRERARREFQPLLESIRAVNTLAQEAKKHAHRGDAERAVRMERIGSFTQFIDQMAGFLELFANVGAGPLTATMRLATKFMR